MLALFRNRKKSETRVNKAQDELARKIVTTCLRLQVKSATWLQMKSEQLSRKTKVIVFTLFIGWSGSYSFYLIFKGGAESTFIPINQAEHFKPPNQIKEDRTLLNTEEYERIQKFKGYMDSLACSPTGRNRYEHILITRPGLMDSINLIDSLYQQHLKK